MSKLRKHPSTPDHKKEMARIVKQRMTIVISFLMVILVVLIFAIGETWWSTWIVEHRKQIVAVILFFAVFLVVLSPVIVEATSNTRTLSGPGKIHKAHGLSEFEQHPDCLISNQSRPTQPANAISLGDDDASR